MQQEIINAVDGSIKPVADLFKKEPTRFFTENDLAAVFIGSCTTPWKPWGWKPFEIETGCHTA